VSVSIVARALASTCEASTSSGVPAAHRERAQPLRRTMRLGSHTGVSVATWLSGTRRPVISDVMYAPAMSS
jgi:hypothetical protein